MTNQKITNHQLTPNLVNTVQQLTSNLKAIIPPDSETAQIITYALVGTVVAGLVVYHYIKSQEAN